MEKREDQLNDLLEDALDDLLDNTEAEIPAPNIKESLKKITDVTGGEGGGASGGASGGGNCFSQDDDEHNNGEGGSGLGGGIGGGIGINEEEMDKFFENMSAQLKAELPQIGPEEARAKINESVPQIFDLMQNLLSKELLYPALKDLSPKFNEWLKKNETNLSKNDKKRYRKQKDIINEIIYVFDDESIDAQEKFEKNLDLMEKMQSLGSPPEELTVPEGVGKCSVM